MPSLVLAVTMSRFDFLLWVTVSVVSGFSVSSFWKAFLFLGSWASAADFSDFSDFPDFPELPDLPDFPDFPDFWGLAMAFLKRSLVFFRKGK